MASFKEKQLGAYYARKRNRLSVLVDDKAAPAWGTVTFPANPSAGHTVTLNGTVITFGTTVTIGASLAATLAALVAYVVANPVTGLTVRASGNGLSVLSTTPGNNTITLAASNATVSGATLKRQKAHKRVPL